METVGFRSRIHLGLGLRWGTQIAVWYSEPTTLIHRCLNSYKRARGGIIVELTLSCSCQNSHASSRFDQGAYYYGLIDIMPFRV